MTNAHSALLRWALGTLTYRLYVWYRDVRQAARLHRALVRGLERLMGGNN